MCSGVVEARGTATLRGWRRCYAELMESGELRIYDGPGRPRYEAEGLRSVMMLQPPHPPWHFVLQVGVPLVAADGLYLLPG